MERLWYAPDREKMETAEANAAKSLSVRVPFKHGDDDRWWEILLYIYTYIYNKIENLVFYTSIPTHILPPMSDDKSYCMGLIFHVVYIIYVLLK